MRVFKAVWSLQRGVIDPPELIDDAGQHRAEVMAQIADKADRDILRYRAMKGFQVERDPMLTATEVRRAS